MPLSPLSSVLLEHIRKNGPTIVSDIYLEAPDLAIRLYPRGNFSFRTQNIVMGFITNWGVEEAVKELGRTPSHREVHRSVKELLLEGYIQEMPRSPGRFEVTEKLKELWR